MKNILAKIAIAACLISTGANASSSLELINASTPITTQNFANGMSGFNTELSFS